MRCALDLLEFIDFHLPDLERDQVRHNLIIGLLSSTRDRQDQDLMFWTLGPPGACAIKTPGRAIVLGELNDLQCHRLAEETVELDYPGVLGPDQSALLFKTRAEELGLRFEGPIEQGISALTEPPVYPDVPGGVPRRVTADDADRFADWIVKFVKKVSPHDPLPSEELLRSRAGAGQHWFWTVYGEPVSLAGIVRQTRAAAAIASVYTAPSHRNQGFAGAVVSMVVDQIYAGGRKTACLYTNLANPISNRCYEKIGFKQVGTASLQMRVG
ncbi:MAG: GNAT family N-acetyltransferase [Geminicoccaceae bacterium]